MPYSVIHGERPYEPEIVMDQATRYQLETKLGLAEFSLSNSKDPVLTQKLIHIINNLKIALGYY